MVAEVGVGVAVSDDAVPANGVAADNDGVAVTLGSAVGVEDGIAVAGGTGVAVSGTGVSVGIAGTSAGGAVGAGLMSILGS